MNSNDVQSQQQQPTILMVALEFPPCHSAGVQRTLHFAQHLHRSGWRVIVLTVQPRVYSALDEQVEVDPGVHVYRTFALDSARDLAIKGKYFGWSKVPDRWWSWALTAVGKGRKLIRQYQPDVLWSTYPAITAHFIAWRLHRHSGLPWVADYRDPMQSHYDDNARQYSGVARWIEKQTVNCAEKLVFTTAEASLLYQTLYPQQPATRFATIQNGYDEASFNDLPNVTPLPQDKLVLLHSGSVYANGRDPSLLFDALGRLKQQGIVNAENFLLVFRGQKNDRLYRTKLEQLDITELVSFRAGIPYLESLAEMQTAGALLIIQGPLFSNQIPGKVFDCLRVGKPILALTPAQGSTANLLASVAGCHIAADTGEMETCIKALMGHSDPASLEEPLSAPALETHSRRAKGEQLNTLLKSVTGKEVSNRV